MRIGEVGLPEISAPGKIISKTAGLPSAMAEGDSIEAKVLSVSDGGAQLKTADGYIFHARLDGGARLSEGETVTLVVGEKGDGVIFMSVARPDAYPGAETARGAAAPDAALASFTGTLTSLNLPVTDETVARMRALLAANPALPPDEAAFLAANGIDAPNLSDAARALLSGGEKIDQILAELITLVADGDAGAASAGTVPAETAASLDAAAAGLPEAPATPETAAGLAAESVIEIAPGTGTEPTAAPAVSAAAEPAARTEDTSLVGRGDSARQTEEPAARAQDMRTEDASVAERGDPARRTEEIATRTEDAGVQDANAVGRGDPARRNTEPVAVPARKLADMLGTLASARESVGDLRGVPREKLAQVIENLFSELKSAEKDLGQRLKTVKEELPARLALFEEAVARTNTPQRAAILERTDKTLEHARLASSVEQYAYAQLPVVTRGERRTAELYVFKKKKSGKISADDANILLSLDLSALGHWEAFVKVTGKDVSVQMRAATDEAREYLSDNTAKLHELLRDAGYRLSGARVTRGDGETTPLTALAALSEYGGVRSAGVDFIV
ncbi:MAG: flagellar hook-length control protein FliK [Oscillospiraceae bacterium]|jgi:hypothetical protein|nr:flagellar hook-length control protein FliK [Oscillospiraceae bacterium]